MARGSLSSTPNARKTSWVAGPLKRTNPRAERPGGELTAQMVSGLGMTNFNPSPQRKRHPRLGFKMNAGIASPEGQRVSAGENINNHAVRRYRGFGRPRMAA